MGDHYRYRAAWWDQDICPTCTGGSINSPVWWPCDKAYDQRNWRGMSLAYFRRLSRRRDIPVEASVKTLHARMEAEGRLLQADPPRLGDFILWPNASRYGDCGMYLGSDAYLILDPSGHPRVANRPYYDQPFYIVVKPKKEKPHE